MLIIPDYSVKYQNTQKMMISGSEPKAVCFLSLKVEKKNPLLSYNQIYNDTLICWT